LRRGGWLLALLALPVAVCAAAEFVEDFDKPNTTWRVRFDEAQCQLLSHSRHARIFHNGAGSENVQIDVRSQISPVLLEHRLPPSRVLDELTLSLWVRSNRAGATLAVRLVFPHQRDPRTGRMLTDILKGETYTDAGKWQLLTCRTTDKAIKERLWLLRAQFREAQWNPDIEARGLYVDQALLSVEAGKGTTELFLDDLKLSPVVASTAGSNDAALQEEAPPPAVEMRLDRLLVEGRPFFPLFTPYHGESLDQLADLRFNPVWIPDYASPEVLAALRARRLWAMATPPMLRSPEGELLKAENASLPPFGSEVDPILFWMLGTGIPPREKEHFINWREQLLSADRRMNRPLVADVAGLERIYSRLVPMLGVSRPTHQTGFGYREYRDWLLERQKLARSGSFVWTMIQTEPAEPVAAARRAARKLPAVVEPEQLRLQVYAALSAGCKGLGYWKTGPLDAEQPGSRETRLAIKQLNLEIQLLEAWLATGTLIGHKKFTVVDPSGTPATPSAPKASVQKTTFKNTASTAPQAKYRGPEARKPPRPVQPASAASQDEFEAALIKTDFGLLLLPVWYGRQAQFVPGQMTAENVTIVVEGVEETAAVWEVSTTHIHNLTRRPTAGGVSITLPLLDMTSAVVITSDRDEYEKLRQRVEALQPAAAQVAVELARAKLQRVRAVVHELQRVGADHPRSRQMLDDAEVLTGLAADNLKLEVFHDARVNAQAALRQLRILQRALWDDAVSKLSDPVSSPHTLCFQTLPDHYRLIRQMGRTPLALDQNLLRSGDFEDADTIRAESWGHEQKQVDGVRATAELYPLPHRGNYCLRLVAAPAAGEDPPTTVGERPVTVTTPPVAVRAGQIVHINGWVRLVTPIVRSLDGAMFYDSIGGPEGAIRWHDASDWKRFELIREVQESTDLTIKITLTGLGEIQFDDLRVIPQNPLEERAAGDQPRGFEESKFGLSRPVRSPPRLPAGKPPQGR
jgi:hypothetical protein